MQRKTTPGRKTAKPSGRGPDGQRPPGQRQHDLMVISEMYCRGAHQWEMAERVGVAQSTISTDLAYIRAVWLSRAADKIAERKAAELARLDHLERVAWEAWDRSCRNAEQKHVKTLRKGKTKIQTLEHTSKGQAGDPRFLDQIRLIIRQRCEIAGVLKQGSPGIDVWFKSYGGFDPIATINHRSNSSN